MAHVEENAMTTLNTVSIADLKRAIEGRDAKTLIGFYEENATLRIIDRENAPSKPRELKGKAAIAAYYEDVCGRAMTHRIESGVSDGKQLAYTQVCTYPEGGKVFCVAMLELKDGKIVRQTAVQAWDE
jgi:hypothetical protein